MTITPVCVLDCASGLGEGPTWVARDSSLWFVDIIGKQINCFTPASRRMQSWSTPEKVAWVVPSSDGYFIAGLKSGIHRFNPADGSLALLLKAPAGGTNNRLNDAIVDPQGRLWFGTMDDNEADASGRLYRLDRQGCHDTGLPPIVITNGPALSPDGRFIYPVDTLTRRILRAEVDADGRLGSVTIFAEIEDGAGYPDGAICDAEGCIWIGLFGGWSARRYAPSGALLQTVSFPVANITKIAFGGPDLRTAYATTARKGLDQSALDAQPLAGGLFAFDPGISGIPQAGIVEDITFEFRAPRT